jgi:uncharacterized protein with FMN-binding domain
MRRAPIVLAGTAAGLAGVLAYHTTGSKNLVLTGAGAPAPSAHTATGTGRARRHTRHGAAGKSATAPRSITTHTSSATAAAAPPPTATSRTALGQAVSYPYGDLQLKVTKRGSRITHIEIVRLSVPEQQSAQIDQSAVPELQSQALTAQSANISGISGASYTSAAYRQSLQSALDKL